MITFACGRRKIEKKARKKILSVGNGKIQGTMSGMDVRYKDIFLPGLFLPDSRGLFGIEESNNLHLFPLVPWLMKNAFTTCFALTGFSGGFWSLATCHLDWSWWKYDVQVMAFSASSICCSVIEAGLVKGIWAINKAWGGLGASTYCTAAVKDKNLLLFFSEWSRKCPFIWLKAEYYCLILSKKKKEKCGIFGYNSSSIYAVCYSTFWSGAPRAPRKLGQPAELPTPPVSITINCLWTAPIITSIIRCPAHLMGFFPTITSLWMDRE